jgi:NADPH2:quinone reductase
MFRVVSNVNKDNEVELFIKKSRSPLEEDLKPNELVVRIEAAPINPSDLGVIMPPGSDVKALKTIKSLQDRVGLSYQIDPRFAKLIGHRVNKHVPVGNEGAGVVVKAGTSPEAQKLLNKVVSTNGAMYAEFRKTTVSQVLVHEEGTSSLEAASSYVNPMTVVAFLETMRMENHKAIIHTAAASQLGQMLVKLCLKEGVNLINVVRKESQEVLLRNLGAKYVIRSDKETFLSDLAEAVAETEATLAFDAIGGGRMASNLLTAMEMGAKKFAKNYDPTTPYGTDVFKQVYIYGGLDRSPTVLGQSFGFSWALGAWLMPRFLAKVPVERMFELRRTVAKNIKTIFKTEYFKKVSLEEMVSPENFLQYCKQETGKKFLVVPTTTSNKL